MGVLGGNRYEVDYAQCGSRSQSALLIDLVAAAWAAYSLRRLRTAYTGPAIRVMRSSDSMEQDIGFVGDDLDVAAIAAFVTAGKGVGRVVKWYDQSGNGRDFVPNFTGASNTPIIVESGTGVVNTKNSLPVMRLTGTTTEGLFYDNGSAVSFANNTSAGVVSIETGCANYGRIVDAASASASDSDVNGMIMLTYRTTGTKAGSYNNGAESYTSGITLGQLSTWRNVSLSGGTVTPAWNGTAAATHLNNTPSWRYISIGDLLGGGNLPKAYLGELIVWQTNLGASDIATLQSNQKAYWGTP